MEKLGGGSMAILWSAPARVYSRDVDDQYRQDSDLLYLTGIEQPEKPRAYLWQPSPKRGPVHHAVEPATGALRRKVPDQTEEAHRADRHRDGVPDHRVQSIPGHDVLSSACTACPSMRRATTPTTTVSSRRWTTALQRLALRLEDIPE